MKRLTAVLFTLLLFSFSLKGQEARGYSLRTAVKEAIQDTLGEVPFAMLAELDRGKKKAAIFWPLFQKANGAWDDDIMGVIFRRKKGKWVRDSRFYEVSHSDLKNFWQDFGEAPFELTRPAGIGYEEIPEYINLHVKRARWAYNKKDYPEMMRVAESLSRMFNLHLSCWRDAVSEMILFAIRTEEYSFQVKSLTREDNSAQGEFLITYKRPEKKAIITLGTFQLSETPEGWRVVDGKEEQYISDQ